MCKLILALLCFSLPLFANKPVVLVSIAPYKYFVERIGGDLVETSLLVPPGASPHTFEPTAKKIVESSKANIWFRIGEPFESQALPALKHHNPKMKIVDLRNGIDLICEGAGACSHGADPHIWLSPRLAAKQAQAIAAALQQELPQERQTLENNLQSFVADLQKLDQANQKLFANIKKRTILVSHPAYGYFSKDYGIVQLSIETEGREPTPKHVQKVLEQAREEGITTVFAQSQHSLRGAQRIADELGGKVVLLDPLSQDYLENIKKTAEAFAKQL